MARSIPKCPAGHFNCDGTKRSCRPGSHVPSSSPIATTAPTSSQAVREDYTHLDVARERFTRNVPEPAPVDEETFTVTHPSGPVATVSHVTWSDGRHTVTAKWVTEDGTLATSVIADTDDIPDIDGAIRSWREHSRPFPRKWPANRTGSLR